MGGIDACHNMEAMCHGLAMIGVVEFLPDFNSGSSMVSVRSNVLLDRGNLGQTGTALSGVTPNIACFALDVFRFAKRAIASSRVGAAAITAGRA